MYKVIINNEQGATLVDKDVATKTAAKNEFRGWDKPRNISGRILDEDGQEVACKESGSSLKWSK